MQVNRGQMPNSESTPAAPRAVRLQDYRPPEFRIKSLDLHFELDADHTRVETRFEITRVFESRSAPLILDGEDLDLESVRVDGNLLDTAAFSVNAKQLVIPDLPDACVVEIRNSIQPALNTSLMGLYRSGHALCTQCEAEGFRRITYFPDRPDVLSV